MDRACAGRTHLPQCIGMAVVHHVEAAVHVHPDGRPLCIAQVQKHKSAQGRDVLYRSSGQPDASCLHCGCSSVIPRPHICSKLAGNCSVNSIKGEMEAAHVNQTTHFFGALRGCPAGSRSSRLLCRAGSGTVATNAVDCQRDTRMQLEGHLTDTWMEQLARCKRSFYYNSTARLTANLPRAPYSA